jgi:hypothetical protein
VRLSVELAGDVLLDQVVGALVVEDDVDLAGSGTADVRAEHDSVGGVTVHVLLDKRAGEHLDVATSAVNVLLVLDRELERISGRGGQCDTRPG